MRCFGGDICSKLNEPHSQEVCFNSNCKNATEVDGESIYDENESVYVDLYVNGSTNFSNKLDKMFEINKYNGSNYFEIDVPYLNYKKYKRSGEANETEAIEEIQNTTSVMTHIFVNTSTIPENEKSNETEMNFENLDNSTNRMINESLISITTDVLLETTSETSNFIEPTTQLSKTQISTTELTPCKINF